MRIVTLATVLAAATLAAGAARAQAGDFAQTLAAGLEEVGQSVGEAAFAGSSLFITAKGHVRLPAPLTDAYFITVQGEDASAVAAARIRDVKVAQLTAEAHRTGVDIEQGQTSIAYQVDAKAQERANANRLARFQAGAASASATPEPVKVFIASASLRFRPPPGRDAAAFLDAVHAAGVDDISHGVNGAANPFLPHGTEAFGFGSLDTLDDGLWSTAAADALAHARTQAQALATKADRALGPVRSMIVVSRGIEGGEAVESLAVRFALEAPAH